jgi:heme exporter protein C
MRARVFLILSTVLVLVTLAIDLLLIPSLAVTESEKLLIQFSPIFYWHIPVAWIALFAFLCVFIASIAYLVKRKPFWDIVATTSAELGVVFTTLFLLTGSIWAKYAWGTWWEWDARLTSSLVLWIIYVAYFLVRAYISNPEQRARFAAVFGILGFLDVPIVILTLFVSRQMHPGDAAFHLDKWQQMTALTVGVLAFTALYFALLFFVIHLREDASELARLKQSVEEKENE